MNYLDIALVIPLVYGFFTGFSRGIVKEITSLVSLIIGLYIAINFSFYVETYLEGALKEHKALIPVISFALVFSNLGCKPFSIFLIRFLLIVNRESEVALSCAITTDLVCCWK